MMSQNKRAYEPPKAKAYRFDESEQILTMSGGGGSTDNTPDPTADFAANALNNLMVGVNTTIE